MITEPKAPLRKPQGAGESLAEAAQNTEGAKLAARDLAKALGRPEFLRHKDKVRGPAADLLTRFWLHPRVPDGVPLV